MKDLSGFWSWIGVSLSLFYRIYFPKIIPSPRKGAKPNNNSDKMKVLLVVSRKALKERLPFPIPKETCPWLRKVLLYSDCFWSPQRFHHFSFCICACFPVTVVFPQPPSLPWLQGDLWECVNASLQHPGLDTDGKIYIKQVTEHFWR